MPLPDDTHCTLNEKDLPAKIFDEKWKTDIKFLEFSNSINLDRKIDDMEKWIKTFDLKIFSTFNDNTFDNIKHIQDKRYIIETFQSFINAIFISWGNAGSLAKFKCTRLHKDYTEKMDLIKQLDDYCENKKSFQEKLQKYDYITCCKYATYVRYEKRSFRDYILRGYITKNDDDFHIENSCTLKKSGVTFPNVMCNEGKMSEFESDELPIAPVNGHLIASQQHMLSGKIPEDSINSSPTKIALTSVSTLLGACLSGLYLYRRSFVGGILRNFQNKNHISNEDTYDDVNGMFSDGSSHYLSTTAENNVFHIAYDPINN
ncbi:PIR Superfamily Protein [Plasmodium ovale curtisi]|uniref:PIR Superfamily Protein n=1 Tax=Plasmodium ovale curtisi TaxID=864141 RepID=A0A1A8XCH7_PLAOA|nr:PIR Superfamily Protein [Plasmodium ovale curtisi]